MRTTLHELREIIREALGNNSWDSFHEFYVLVELPDEQDPGRGWGYPHVVDVTDDFDDALLIARHETRNAAALAVNVYALDGDDAFEAAYWWASNPVSKKRGLAIVKTQHEPAFITAEKIRNLPEKS